MPRNSKDNSLSRYERMLEVVVRYNDYLKHPRIRIAFSSSSRKRNSEAAQYVRKVKETLASLTKGDRFMLTYEFFDNKDQFWWEKYYSKSTYYRRRNFAIRAFMEKFEQ